MTTSVRTKPQKKQSLNESASRELEQSLLSLESACMYILDSQFAHDREDEDGLLWQRRFKNIVTPISLALSEYKGPRRFHFHYKHREDDDSVLHPVMEDPLERLAQVCQSALAECRQCVGISNPDITENCQILSQALKKFLLRYAESRKELLA